MSTNAHILVVEDDKDLRALLTKTFEDEGFTVTGIEDGVEALARAIKGGVDLILLDLDIPGIEGTTVLQKLRESETGGQKTPVIIFSNHADMENLSKTMEYDVHSFLTKSDWELRDVVAKVKEALGT